MEAKEIGRNEGNREGYDIDQNVEGKLLIEIEERAGNTGDRHTGCAQTEQRGQETTAAAADHGHNEGLYKAQVDTKDSGFGDAEQSGQAGGVCNLLGLGRECLDGDCQNRTGLCDVAAGADRVEVVPAIVCQHADFEEVQDVMDAEDAEQLTKTAVEQTADAKGQREQTFNSVQDNIFYRVQDGAEDEQRQNDADDQRDERGDNQIDGIRDTLAQPFFKFGS